MSKPLVSVVVTTRNEQRHIGNCLSSVQNQSYSNIEMIVVDNNSTDDTEEISRKFTDKFFTLGPERSAQRNHGILKAARGKYALFLDADMIVAPTVVKTCVERCTSDEGCGGIYIPEVVFGRGFLASIRRFERSFYDGTVVDCARFFSRDAFVKVGGFDENFSGPEDWDFDKRLRQITRVELLAEYDFENITGFVKSLPRPIKGAELLGEPNKSPVVYHNESEIDLPTYLRKKIYYVTDMSAYAEKWQGDADAKKQLGFGYRFFGVFMENGKWKKLLRHPILTIAMYALRFVVGMAYLFRRRK